MLKRNHEPACRQAGWNGLKSTKIKAGEVLIIYAKKK